MMRSVWVSIISNPFQCLAVAPMPFEAPHSMLPNHQVAVGDTLGNYLKTNGEGDAIRRASRPTARDRDFRTGSNAVNWRRFSARSLSRASTKRFDSRVRRLSKTETAAAVTQRRNFVKSL